ncbi:MAG: DUF2784 domain-containing protein [Gammaproteobacteria bacterium]|nr:DUF2784 domain-containing protein [Gammaproteobacteria bacterium]
MQTGYAFLADALVVLHMLFVVFVVCGGFLALKLLKILYFHIPAVVWGVYIEFSGGICPLTPLENWLRIQSGQQGYAGGFIERHIIPVLYPINLTRDAQMILGLAALLINVLAYGLLVMRLKKRKKL